MATLGTAQPQLVVFILIFNKTIIKVQIIEVSKLVCSTAALIAFIIISNSETIITWNNISAICT